MYNITDKSEAIREFKKYLYAISKNLYTEIQTVGINGIFDDDTQKSVKTYQNIKGINETGIVDYETFNSAYSDYISIRNDLHTNDFIAENDRFPFSIGDFGDDVAIIHAIINQLRFEYKDLSLVGNKNYYSNATSAAIKELQKIFCLEETGSLDKITYYRMIQELKSIRSKDGL